MYSICISGQQYATIMCTNSDSLRCFTFEKKDALYETVSDMKIASYNDNVKRTICKLITIYTRFKLIIFFLNCRRQVRTKRQTHVSSCSLFRTKPHFSSPNSASRTSGRIIERTFLYFLWQTNRT